jgi:hypothetical protein
VEEPFVIADLAITVRNLRPDEYDAIYRDCQGLQDVEYMHAWQIAHVCRAIIELNGVDLRDVQFVEDEEPDPTRKDKTKLVKSELHSYLRKNVCRSWGREVVFIVYRKIADAIEAAEKKSQEGITFRIPDEVPEDKFRRLIGEAKALEDDVPERIRTSVLADHGYMSRTTAEELQKADEKLSEVAAAQEPTPSSEAPTGALEEEPEAPLKEIGPPSPARMAAILRDRVPMNQQPGANIPLSQPLQREAQQVTAQPAQPALPVHATPQASLSGRAASLAALEVNADTIGALEGSSQLPQVPASIPEIRLGSSPKLDPKAVAGIMDTPPQGGINPRFKPSR